MLAAANRITLVAGTKAGKTYDAMATTNASPTHKKAAHWQNQGRLKNLSVDLSGQRRSKLYVWWHKPAHQK